MKGLSANSVKLLLLQVIEQSASSSLIGDTWIHGPGVPCGGCQYCPYLDLFMASVGLLSIYHHLLPSCYLFPIPPPLPQVTADALTLHYFSPRAGLAPFMEGIINETAQQVRGWEASLRGSADDEDWVLHS